MKTILIPISNSFFVRNFLRTDAFNNMRDMPEVRLVFLAFPDKIEYYRREFLAGDTVFDILPNIRLKFFERFFKFWEYSSVHTRTSKMLLEDYLFYNEAKESVLRRLFFFLVGMMCWNLGKFRRWHSLIRRIYKFSNHREIDELLDKWQPDLVFAPSMVYPEDHALLRAAKKNGIKTIGMVLSWDNLWSKAILRVFPDKLLVHVDLIKKQAIEMAGYPAEKIIVTGIPQYDRHFNKRGIAGREEFFKSIGADPRKKLLVYALSGKKSLQLDIDILKIIGKNIKNQRIEENVEVLVRPYPRLGLSEEAISELRANYSFLSHPAVTNVGSGSDSWEFGEGSIEFLLNTLEYADIVLVTHSTFFIEAANFDKPLIGVAFDADPRADYRHSAKRFFKWEHLAGIKETGGIWLVNSEEELINAINSYLENPKLLSSGRRRIVETQTQFTDGESGVRLAKAVLEML